MPRRTPHPCATPGCPALVHPPASHCPSHTKQVDRQRGSAQKRGYTAAWARYSHDRLAQHPFCVGYPANVHKRPVPG